MSNNAETIARLRAEADQLEAADKAFAELPEDQRLAITLHELLCHWNHTDGCSWEYEYLAKPQGWVGKSAPDWNGHAHSRYLAKARTMLTCCKNAGITADVAVNILKITKEL